MFRLPPWTRADYSHDISRVYHPADGCIVCRGSAIVWSDNCLTAILGSEAMRVFSVFAGALLLNVYATSALADAKSYCEVFGQDFASAKTSDVDEWQTDLPQRVQQLHGSVHERNEGRAASSKKRRRRRFPRKSWWCRRRQLPERSASGFWSRDQTHGLRRARQSMHRLTAEPATTNPKPARKTLQHLVQRI